MPPLALWAIHPQDIWKEKNGGGVADRAGFGGAFWAGGMVGIPIVLGYLPIAFSFGVAATRAGLSVAEAVTLSLLIYSGAAQFVAIALIAANAPFLVAFLTLVGMSLRHVLYGPSLMRAAGQSTRLGGIWGFGLTDEVFGAALGALARGQKFSDSFMLALAGAAYAAWVGGTYLGAKAGAAALQDWPMLDATLGFMLTALFLALLLSILKAAQLPVIIAAVTVMVLVGAVVSPVVGLLAGMVAGALIGTVQNAG